MFAKRRAACSPGVWTLKLFRIEASRVALAVMLLIESVGARLLVSRSMSVVSTPLGCKSARTSMHEYVCNVHNSIISTCKALGSLAVGNFENRALLMAAQDDFVCDAWWHVDASQLLGFMSEDCSWSREP